MNATAHRGAFDQNRLNRSNVSFKLECIKLLWDNQCPKYELGEGLSETIKYFNYVHATDKGS